MLILVDKKLCTAEEVQGGHTKLADPANQTLFVSWLSFCQWLFKNHCVLCGESGNQTHHIVPKSHGKESDDWRNFLLVCTDCHEKIHRVGINKTNIVKLQGKRATVLRSYDREKYI